MYANHLANHMSGIYLRDPSTFDQLESAFGQFEEILQQIALSADRGCPPGTYPCGPNSCCVPSGGPGHRAREAEQ
jgi:hypothetical protein